MSWRVRARARRAPRCSADRASAYDTNGDGTFNAADYATDPRVADSNGNGIRDPEDPIVSFSNGIDNDGNGWVRAVDDARNSARPRTVTRN